MFSAAIKRTLSVLVAAVRRTDESLRRNLVAAGENLSAHKAVLIYGLVWTLIAFGYEMAQFTFSADDEHYAYDPAPWYRWGIEGRFSPYIFGILFNSLSLPFFPLFFSGLCMLGAYYLIFMREKEESDAVHYFGIPLFLSAPILCFNYVYNMLIPVIGFGFLCSAICVRLFETKRPFALLFGLLAGIAAVGCYQVFFPAILCLLILSLIQNMEGKTFSRFAAACALHVLYALAVYAAYMGVWKLYLFCKKKPMSSYLTNQIDFDPSSASALLEQARNVFLRIWKALLGDASVFSENMRAMALLIALSLFVFLSFQAIRFWKRESRSLIWKESALILLALAFLAAPFLFHMLAITHGGATWRTTSAFALIPPALIVLAWRRAGSYARIALGATAVCAILQFLYVDSKLFYICKLNEDRARSLAEDIIREITPEARLDSSKPILLCKVGIYSYPTNPKQFISGKYYTTIAPASCSAYAVCRYMNSFLNFDFQPAPPARFPEVEDAIAEMPVYPAKGSIRYVNGIAIVKLNHEFHSKEKSDYYPYSRLYRHFLKLENAGGFRKIDEYDPRIGKELWTMNKKTLAVGGGAVKKSEFLPDGSLKLTIQGSYPVVQMRNPEKIAAATDHVCLSLKFTSDADDRLTIFFKRRLVPDGELLQGSVALAMKKGENSVLLKFPKEILSGGLLRIDPGRGKTRNFVFHEIAIKDFDSSLKLPNAPSVFGSAARADGFSLRPLNDPAIGEAIWTLSKANANVSMRCVRKADFGADGTLKLLVHGNDPILTLKNLPKSQDASSSLCLSLKFTANAQEKLQVFFKRRKSPDSKEFVLGHFVVPMLKGDNLVQVAFPKEILDGGLLRIDPGSGKATEVLFEEIAIKNMKQKQ